VWPPSAHPFPFISLHRPPLCDIYPLSKLAEKERGRLFSNAIGVVFARLRRSVFGSLCTIGVFRGLIDSFTHTSCTGVFVGSLCPIGAFRGIIDSFTHTSCTGVLGGVCVLSVSSGCLTPSNAANVPDWQDLVAVICGSDFCTLHSLLIYWSLS